MDTRDLPEDAYQIIKINMAYKNEEFKEDRYIKPLKDRLSEQQLIEFDNEIDSFSQEKEVTLPNGKIVKIFDEIKWLKSKGALTKDGEVIMTNYKYAIYDINGHLKKHTDCDPILFEQLQTDLHQWRMWKGRKEYFETRKIEGLEDLAEKMKIN